MQRLHTDSAGFKNKGMCGDKHIPYSVTQVNEAYELLYKKSGKRHSGNNMPFVCDKTFPESINMQIF